MKSLGLLWLSLAVLTLSCTALDTVKGTLDPDTKGFYLEELDPQLSPEDTINLEALELEYFAHQIQYDPFPGQDAVVLPSCPNGKMAPPDQIPEGLEANQKRNFLSGLLRPLRDFLESLNREFLEDQRPRIQLCTGAPLDGEIIPVVFHWHGNVNATERNVTDIRIGRQMELVNDVFNPLGIRFHHARPLRELVSEGITTPYEVSNGQNQAVRARTRVPNQTVMNVLNVWLVDTPYDGTTNLNGRAEFPWKGVSWDGITLSQRALLGSGSIYTPSRNNGGPLIHEMGHWLGLYHSFPDKESTCAAATVNATTYNAIDDQVFDTDMTPSSPEDIVYNCTQELCPNPSEGGFSGISGFRFVHNFMSYSNCRGWNSGTDRTFSSLSFTAGQRARMYAAWTFWRAADRTISSQCPGPVVRPPRSRMSMLKRGVSSLIGGESQDSLEEFRALRVKRHEENLARRNITYLPTRPGATIASLRDADIIERLKNEVLFCVPDDHSPLSLHMPNEEPPKPEPGSGGNNNPPGNPQSVTRPNTSPTPGSTPGTIVMPPSSPIPGTVVMPPSSPVPGTIVTPPSSPIPGDSDPTTPILGTPTITPTVTPGIDSGNLPDTGIGGGNPTATSSGGNGGSEPSPSSSPPPAFDGGAMSKVNFPGKEIVVAIVLTVGVNYFGFVL